MAVTPTGSDGSLPVTIVSGSISSSASEKTTLAACTTLDELYKIAVTGTGKASTPSINLIEMSGFTAPTAVGQANFLPMIGIQTDLSPSSAIDIVSSQQLKIKSTTANDTNGGTGAWTVKIYGLDSNYAEISETVTMNGTTAVTTVNSYIAVNYMKVVTVGTLKVNDGNIIIRNNAESLILGCIPSNGSSGSPAIQNNVSSTLGFTVPAGKTLILYDIKASAMLTALGASTIVQGAVRCQYRHPDTGLRIYDRQGVHSQSTSIIVPSLTVVPEKTSFVLLGCESTASSTIYGHAKGILVGSVLTSSEYWS